MPDLNSTPSAPPPLERKQSMRKPVAISTINAPISPAIPPTVSQVDFDEIPVGGGKGPMRGDLASIQEESNDYQSQQPPRKINRTALRAESESQLSTQPPQISPRVAEPQKPVVSSPVQDDSFLDQDSSHPLSGVPNLAALPVPEDLLPAHE